MSLFKIIEEFNKKNIKYAVIGVSGINAYMDNHSDALFTLDYDIFIKPEEKNIKAALKIMLLNNYKIVSLAPGLPGLPDNQESLHKLCFNKYTVKLQHEKTNFEIELIQDIDGFTFSEIYENSLKIRINDIIFTVGHIKDLIRSKELASREKDYDFLDKNACLLKELIKKIDGLKND